MFNFSLVLVSLVSQIDSMAFFSHGSLGAEPARDSTETGGNNALDRFQGDEHSWVAHSAIGPCFQERRADSLGGITH